MKYLRRKIIFQGEHHRICKVIMMLVLAFVAGTNCNAQTFTSGDLNYKVTSTTALTVEVIGPAAGVTYAGPLTIPSTVVYNSNTYTVTSIGESAFRLCKSLTGTLSLPSTIKTIGAHAFRGASLTGNIDIPEGVTSIGSRAFYFSSTFNGTITLPSSLTYIGDEAFNGCTGLTGDLLIPDGVSVINYAIFANCTSLNGKLHIPANVTSIANNAFQSCTNLKGPLTIPAGVTSIGKMAFYLCKNLTGDLVIPDGVTTIGSSAFGQCGKLTGVAKIPAAVTSIGDGAFSGCGNVFCSISAGFAGSVGAGAFTSTKGVWFNDKTPAFTSATGGLGVSTTYYIPEDDVASNAQTDATSIKALYQAKIISTSNVIIRYYHLGLKTVSRPLADITIHNYGHATAGVATLYVNFPALVPSGLKAFYGKEVKSAGAVYITSIDNTLNSSASIPSISKSVTSTVIPTRCPVVLMGDVIANDTVFEAVKTGTSVAFGTAIEPTGANAQKGILSGSLTNIDKSTVTGGDVYTFGIGNTSGVLGFYPYNGTTLSAHKAYLLKTPEMLSKNNEYVLSIDNSSNQTDAISGTTLGSSAVDNAPYFTLQGVRIAKPTKGGIYIHNGKKIMMY